MPRDEPPRARQADFNDGAGPMPRAGTTKRRITAIWRLQEILPPGLLVPIVVCIAGWFGYLAATGTIDNYMLGTFSYHTGTVRRLWPEFTTNLADLFKFVRANESDILAFQFHKLIAWFLLATLVAAGFSVTLRLRRGNREGAVVVAVTTLWFLGSFVQAVAGLTFFRHYFLACLAPAAIVTGVLMRDAWRLGVLAFVVLPVAVLTSFWTWKYASWAPAIAERGRQAPMTHTVSGLRMLLPPGAKVFNWNGLPHFHAYTRRASDYPLNIWWPWIMASLPVARRDERLRAIFHSSAPDFFLEIVESYPQNRNLLGVPLSSDLLERWTGKRYELSATVTPPAGRYGAPARVFRRID